MMLVAAIAIGLWGLRQSNDPYGLRLENRELKIAFFGTLLMVMSIATLFIRLRKPRPNRRRLMRQPGLVFCTSVVLQNATINLLVLIRDLLNQPGYQEGFWQRLISPEFKICFIAGLAVFMCWCLFAIAGFLKREVGWIDRLGVFLGIGWIMVALATLYLRGIIMRLGHSLGRIQPSIVASRVAGNPSSSADAASP